MKKAEVVKMDDLEFRRAVYTAPFTNDEKVVQAAQEDDAKKQFWDELKEMESNIHKATMVKVPSELAHKLILRQSLKLHQEHKKRSRVYLALAASVAFAVGLSIKVFNQDANYINLGEHAIAHVYETEGSEMLASANLPLNMVNSKLASFGSEFTTEIGRIFSANYCYLNKLKALHIIMSGEQGKVSVFVLPHNKDYDLQEVFSDENYVGTSNRFGNTDMIIVGEKGENIEEFKTKLADKFNQSI